MSALPIAANLPSVMYAPLVILLAGYAILGILAARARGHDDRASAERFGAIGFALVLAGAVWSVVLLLSAVVSYPNRIYDMIIIVVMIVVFFAVLLLVFFALAELLPRVLKRGDDR
ncbi:MAG: hypothetical protein QOE69_2340 [Thermoleophilaceae bacterium]|nr:hypothetical protein [Thermoleophilaceae bacterium]